MSVLVELGSLQTVRVRLIVLRGLLATVSLVGVDADQVAIAGTLRRLLTSVVTLPALQMALLLSHPLRLDLTLEFFVLLIKFHLPL